MSIQRTLPVRIISHALCFIIGAVFIFSGISKIPTLEQFGWTIVETTPLNWTLAEWSARILIGLELFLGVLFIFHLKLKRIAIPVSLVLLSVFTIYLFLVIKAHGSSGNCGCFGEAVPMTPLQSVYKNIAMLVVIVILYFIYIELKFKYSILAVVIALCVSVSVPFVFSPIFIYEKEKDINEPIPLSILYQSEKNAPPTEELRKGKHVIVFMSLTCEYCRKAAKRIRIMKEKHPELPFYAVLNGHTDHLKEFFEDTKMNNVPYTMFNGANEFLLLSGEHGLPAIKWVKDTTIIRESNYITLDENDILKWMKE